MGVSILRKHLIQISLLVAYSFLAISCGGGGSDSSGRPTVTSPPPPPPAAVPTSVSLSSDASDWIGAGQSYSYTNADAQITVTSQVAKFTIAIKGDESWKGEFELPDTYTELQPGTYENLARYGHDTAAGGLSWTGEGRGCNGSSGRLVIDSVAYDGTTLAEIDLEFEQYCSGSTGALRGDIYWNANDATGPPPPVVPPPTGLWKPQGITPATDNYVYLESEPGDYIGAGANYLYTGVTALMTVNAANARVSVGIRGNEAWVGDFQAMSSISSLEVGFYPDVQGYPSHNPTKGGLQWSGESRTCSTVAGWFVVDSVTYDGDTLTAIKLRFEQFCGDSIGALRGEIHWDASDITNPPGPVVPPPARLWQPAASVTPDTGNYVYLESQPGDFIGQGRNYLYTPIESLLTADAEGARLTVSVNGDEYWDGTFQAMNILSRLEVGYYSDLRRFPFHNPVKGGLSWSGEHRGCNTLTGWFVIDDVTYDGTTLMAIDLRFEQHCDGVEAPLNGEVRWDANDTTGPPGPVVPPPAGLWQPAANAIPDTGNYVYLESEPGDSIGQGRNYLYTPIESVLTADAEDARLTVSVNGDESWNGTFRAMNTLSRLEVGYYSDLRRFPFHNPVKGGLSWSGEHRGCNTLTGWFVIDDVTYDGTTLMAIELRFEQHCDGIEAPLNGEVRWDASDTTGPPGPVVPPPAGLWEPAQGITPDTGNYVYLESEPGDHIGQGHSYLYTPAASHISIADTGASLSVSIDGNEQWEGNFVGMNSLSRLEVGYYGELQRSSPVNGGLSWFREGRWCSTLTGWFVIDDVTYDGNTLMAIDLRFEQHCKGDGPALNGEVHWDANDTTVPRPVVPPPPGLWEPAQGITPDTGNYVYLESEPRDFIGAGGTYLYTPANSVLMIDAQGAFLTVSIDGDERWKGTFVGMNSLSRLEIGYYGGLRRWPFHNPVRGGLTWSGEHRGCNRLTGWFVIDELTYDGNVLMAIDLRFEQHCEGGEPALNGEVHWEANDT